MGYGGAGAAMVEYVMIVVSVALCGAIAFADPRGLTVQDAIVCAAVVGGGGAGLLMGGIKAVRLAVLLAALVAGTGFWLNQGDWLQHPIF
jgi:hypothetical protein